MSAGTVLVPTKAAKDAWIYVAVARRKNEVVFRFNDAVVDQWEDAPVQHAPLSNLLVIKDAVGFAADIAIYPRQVPQDGLDVHWRVGKKRI